MTGSDDLYKQVDYDPAVHVRASDDGLPSRQIVDKSIRDARNGMRHLLGEGVGTRVASTREVITAALQGLVDLKSYLLVQRKVNPTIWQREVRGKYRPEELDLTEEEIVDWYITFAARMVLHIAKSPRQDDLAELGGMWYILSERVGDEAAQKLVSERSGIAPEKIQHMLSSDFYDELKQRGRVHDFTQLSDKEAFGIDKAVISWCGSLRPIGQRITLNGVSFSIVEMQGSLVTLQPTEGGDEIDGKYVRMKKNEGDDRQQQVWILVGRIKIPGDN